MKYKDLYSVTYDNPNWDEITNSFVEEWVDKIENECWHYADNANKEYDKRSGKYVAPLKKLAYKNMKFNWLIQWEIDNQETKTTKSPLNNLCLDGYKHDNYSNKHIYGLVEKMFDDFYDICEESFVEINMPVLYGVDENNDEYYDHRKELRRVFEKSKEMKTEVENRLDEILKNYFMFKDLCLLVKYQLPDNEELSCNLTDRFDKLILNGDWKVLDENNKLQKPKSKIDFINKLENNDCILTNMYIKSKNSLYEEIKTEVKKNYRTSFIFDNMSPEIKGTMFEDDSIIKFGRLFDEYYDYLAEDFCTDILNMYKKSDILELFEKAETNK